jgi:hypothetical protein
MEAIIEIPNVFPEPDEEPVAAKSKGGGFHKPSPDAALRKCVDQIHVATNAMQVLDWDNVPPELAEELAKELKQYRTRITRNITKMKRSIPAKGAS